MFPEPYNGFFAEGREKTWKEIIERKNKKQGQDSGGGGEGPLQRTDFSMPSPGRPRSPFLLPPSCPSLLKEKNKWLLRPVL